MSALGEGGHVRFHISDRFHVLAALTLCSGLLLSSCGSAPPLPAPPKELPPDDSLIVPGNRIGSVAIGMTSKQLLKAKGSPSSSPMRYTDAANYSYDQLRYSVVVDDATQQVWRIATSDGRYRTVEGVGVGQTELEMRADLGNPDQTKDMGNDTFLYCYDKGLAIYIAQNKIIQASVFIPGGVCE